MAMLEEGDIQFTARIMGEGRITIPESVRDVMELVQGDVVQITIRKLKSKK